MESVRRRKEGTNRDGSRWRTVRECGCGLSLLMFVAFVARIFFVSLHLTCENRLNGDVSRRIDLAQAARYDAS